MGPKLLIFFVLAVALSCIAAVGYYRARGAQDTAASPAVKPEIVRAVPLEIRAIPVTETFYGRIEAEMTLDMAFNVPGRLQLLGKDADTVLRENDLVRRDDQIAALEVERFDAQLAKAKAYWERASAQQAAAAARTEEAQANADQAMRELENQRRLLARNAANQRDVDRAETAWKVASAELKSARAVEAQASAEYKAADADMREAEFNLKEAKLFAPFDGKVAAVPVEIGTALRPGQVVMRLVAMKKVRLVVGVVERKLPRIHEGQHVSVEVFALDTAAQASRGVAARAAARPGVVRIVPPAADRATNLFHVEIELDNADGALRPGMIGKATVTVQRDARAIAIPAAAVMRRGNRGSAYFVRDGLPIGLDMGALGKADLTVPTTVVQEVVFNLEQVPMEGDHYLLTQAPTGLSQLVVEGQSRITHGAPVRVVSGPPPSMDPAVRMKKETVKPVDKQSASGQK